LPVAVAGIIPCELAQSPQNNVATDGGVHGASVNARLKSTFSRAKRSMLGVVSRSYPRAPMWSARVVSRSKTTMFGRAGEREHDTAHHVAALTASATARSIGVRRVVPRVRIVAARPDIVRSHVLG